MTTNISSNMDEDGDLEDFFDDESGETSESDDSFSNKNVNSIKNDTFSREKKGKSHSNVQKHLNDIKKTLGLSENDILKYKKEKNKNLNASNKQKNVERVSRGVKRPPPEIVVFDDPAKRKQKREEMLSKNLKTGRKHSSKSEDDDLPKFDLIRAKYEVRKFGIEGLKPQNKSEAVVDLLMELGAKKPKPEHMNVKQHQKRKKEKLKQEKHSKAEMHDVVSLNSSSKTQRSSRGGKSKSRKKDFTADGVVGKYVQGVQMLRKTDIQKIQSTKVTKVKSKGKKR